MFSQRSATISVHDSVNFFFFFFFAAIRRKILRPHAMSQLHHGTETLRAKDRRTTHTTGKKTHHTTERPRRTETMNLQWPAHVQSYATKLIKHASGTMGLTVCSSSALKCQRVRLPSLIWRLPKQRRAVRSLRQVGCECFRRKITDTIAVRRRPS